MRRSRSCARSEQRRPIRFAFASALLVPSLCLLVSCRSADTTPVRSIVRPLTQAQGVEIETTTVGDVSRPSIRLRFDQGGVARLRMGALSDGTLLTDLGSPTPGAAPARATIRMRTGDGSSAGAECAVEWAATARPWQSCRLTVRDRKEAAILEVVRDPSAAEQWFLSSPRLITGGRAVLPLVFVILIDTVRADSLLTAGADGGTGLAQLARDGVTFEAARAPSSWTRTSVATLLTGLPPHTHQVYGRLDKLDGGRTTLAEALADHGYGTLAWSTNPNILPVWGFDQGFDAFADVRQVARSKPDARVVFDRVEQALQRNDDDPYFYYIHLMDAHHPLEPTAADRERIQASAVLRSQGANAPEIYADYLAEILGMEERIGAFTAFLQTNDWYRQSLILVVSDHGHEFLEHGRLWHGDTLYEEVLRIPMLLKLPDNRHAGTRRTGPVGLEEIMTTILESASGTSPGPSERSLVMDDTAGHTAEGAAAVATLDLDGNVMDSIVQDGWKLIIDGNDGSEQLFHLAADPAETKNLIAHEPEHAARLRHHLQARIRHDQAGWHLRGCGGTSDGTLRFRLHGPTAVRAYDFEPDDALVKLKTGDERGYDVTMRLPPRSTPDPNSGAAGADANQIPVPDARVAKALRALQAPEHDEVTLSLEGTPGLLEALDGKALRYRLARQGDAHDGDQLSLAALQESATVADAKPLACAVDEPAAYLLLWYVPAAETVAPDKVEDGVVERLRALGYRW